MIYLDNNATTQPLQLVSEIVSTYLGEEFGNPSSVSYDLGKRAKKAVEDARQKVSELVNCEPEEVVFTSGGTEAIYSSILGAVLARANQKEHLIITSPTEHPAVNTCIDLLKKLYPEKIFVEKTKVNKEGEFSNQSANLNKANVVSHIYANNETGILSPVQSIVEVLAESKKNNDVFIHSDTVQLIGKLPFSFKESGFDGISIAAHKLHGPKGVGAMIIRNKSSWLPFITGGGQESGRRGGTENVALIAAFGEASKVAKERIESGEYKQIEKLRDYFEDCLLNEIHDIKIIGKSANRLPNTTSVLIDRILGYEVVEEVSHNGLYISSGSACKSGTFEPSKTLLGMGYSTSEALGLLRISFDYKNTFDEAAAAVKIIKNCVELYRNKFESRLQGVLSKH